MCTYLHLFASHHKSNPQRTHVGSSMQYKTSAAMMASLIAITRSIFSYRQMSLCALNRTICSCLTGDCEPKGAGTLATTLLKFQASTANKPMIHMFRQSGSQASGTRGHLPVFSNNFFSVGYQKLSSSCFSCSAHAASTPRGTPQRPPTPQRSFAPKILPMPQAGRSAGQPFLPYFLPFVVPSFSFCLSFCLLPFSRLLRLFCAFFCWHIPFLCMFYRLSLPFFSYLCLRSSFFSSSLPWFLPFFLRVFLSFFLFSYFVCFCLLPVVLLRR